ncbi:MAG: hypothetical protein GYB31_04030 [Bacteroidetes bacterium]|nr:hypothetical protein [Bacteroidota bacterium]
MEIGEIFYPKVRVEWRQWLAENHQDKKEIWLRRFRKATGIPCINYDELVEEALCFGWIDGLVKKLDVESNVQRISPRRKGKTFLSELNRQRVWKLQRLGLMTPFGESLIKDQIGHPDDPFEVPEYIKVQLQEDPEVWENFQGFDHFYKRLKTGWILECGPRRPEEAQRRLNYLIKMTKKGKMYGTRPEVRAK